MTTLAVLILLAFRAAGLPVPWWLIIAVAMWRVWFWLLGRLLHEIGFLFDRLDGYDRRGYPIKKDAPK